MEVIKSEKYYLDIQLDFGEEYGNEGVDMDVKMFKYTLSLALKTLYGEMGYIIPIDVLKYRDEDRRAFIRVQAKDLVKVWSSLTLFSRYNGLECTFRVYKLKRQQLKWQQLEKKIKKKCIINEKKENC